ncbi:MAG: TlpA family protein disulfide reductase [Candidatus Competibacteraceae bacterium]|nr:TlpA family protein disulfide reductase [Candidatus Competibacteraceae bacterium]
MRLAISVVVVLITVLHGLVYAAPQELTPHPNPQPAPAFTLQDSQGKTHTLADYQGKVIIVNFWATWCPPCVKEMPSLQRAWEQLRQEDIQVLAINMGQDREDIDYFLSKYPVEFPILLDSDVAVAESWGIKGLPTTFVLDASMRMVVEVIGEREWDDPELLNQVRALKTGSNTLSTDRQGTPGTPANSLFAARAGVPKLAQ